jgi:hypothetical protein
MGARLTEAPQRLHRERFRESAGYANVRLCNSNRSSQLQRFCCAVFSSARSMSLSIQLTKNDATEAHIAGRNPAGAVTGMRELFACKRPFVPATRQSQLRHGSRTQVPLGNDHSRCLVYPPCSFMTSSARLEWAKAAPARISAATQMASITCSRVAPARSACFVCPRMQ